MAKSAFFRWLQPPKYLRTGWIISFLVSSVTFLIALVLYPQLPPVIPLFYSLPSPAQHLVPKLWVWFFPTILLAIAFGHLVISRWARNYQPLLLQLFTWTTVAVQIILAITIIRSLYLVS